MTDSDPQLRVRVGSIAWIDRLDDYWKVIYITILLLSGIFLLPKINGTTSASRAFVAASWSLAGFVVGFFRYLIKKEVQDKIWDNRRQIWELERENVQESMNSISQELGSDVPDFSTIQDEMIELMEVMNELESINSQMDIFSSAVKSGIVLLLSGGLFLVSLFWRTPIFMMGDIPIHIEALGFIFFLIGFLYIPRIVLIWYRIWHRDIEEMRWAQRRQNI